MKLIRKLGRRKNKTGNNKQSWGLFWCLFCEKEVERQLNNGKEAKSCGCHKNVLISDKIIKHGESYTRLYGIWGNMKQRCLNSNDINYKNYGDRGVEVCPEWLEFIPFRDWAIQNGYNNFLQIDRINNNGNYEPNNCRWITSQINTQNRRTTKLNKKKANEIRELYKTGNYTQTELGKIYNVDQQTISAIINNKIWSNI